MPFITACYRAKAFALCGFLERVAMQARGLQEPNSVTCGGSSAMQNRRAPLWAGGGLEGMKKHKSKLEKEKEAWNKVMLEEEQANLDSICQP